MKACDSCKIQVLTFRYSQFFESFDNNRYN